MNTYKASILQLRPDFGGLVAYSDTLKHIYEQKGYKVTTLPCPPAMTARQVLRRIHETPADLVHFDIGVGQANLFWSSWLLSLRSRRKQMVTIHDPALIVKTRVALLDHDARQPALVRLPVKVLRKVSNVTIRHGIIRSWARNRRVPKLYLRPDLAERLHGYYLPQATYHAERPPEPVRRESVLRIGFAGYWGPAKGLETLLDAVAECTRRKVGGFELVLAGGGLAPNDEYVEGMKRRARTLGVPVEMPGFIADECLDAFLQGLSVLVLPYWPELPSGTSAMSMRVAELGTPIIASNTPALSQQLGPEGARYVSPKDPSALADALIHFVHHSEEYRRAAIRTQAAVFENHGWPAVGDVLDQTVTKVLHS